MSNDQGRCLATPPHEVASPVNTTGLIRFRSEAEFQACVDRDAQERFRSLGRYLARLPSNRERGESLGRLGKRHSPDFIEKLRQAAWELMRERA